VRIRALRGICVLRDFESKTQSIFVRYILYSTLCFISSKFFEKNETGGAGLWTMGGVYEGHSKKAGRKCPAMKGEVKCRTS